MKLTVFDVSNAACALVLCPNGNSLMIDCGSNDEKDCPVDSILRWRGPNNWLSSMKDHVTADGRRYPMTMLAITHPDLDHVRNSQAVKERLTPYLLNRRYVEHYPQEDADTVDEYYRKNVCEYYRGSNPETPDWGFDRRLQFEIPMDVIAKSEILNTAVKNNSSRVHLIENRGCRMLFGGDLETEGWEWLIANDPSFGTEIEKGVDILIASHHGHKSGFSSALFSRMGPPKLSILSKGSESGDETDVSSQYSRLSEGMPVYDLSLKQSAMRSSVSTRANGTIFVEVGEDGDQAVYIQKNL